MTLKDIVKQTFANLDGAKILPTPSAYAKEFYKIANDVNFPLRDFDKLYTISKIIQKAIEPTLSKNNSNGLIELIMELKNDPANIFDDNIQKKIEAFLESKNQIDTKEFDVKTKKVSMLVKYLGNFLDDAIDTNNSGSNELNSFIKELEDGDFSNDSQSSMIQQKLIELTKNIDKALCVTNEKLQKGQKNIHSLQHEIEELRQELEDAKKESELDHLTGIPSRRMFDKQSKIFEANYQKNKLDYAIVFYDLDYFKRVNDRYGHDAGDFILNAFAKVLNASTRKSDLVARYGGEEFIAIIQYHAADELEKYVQRIKSIINNYTFKYNDTKVNVSFSSGIAIRSNSINLNDCIKKADELLYKAKQSGRNNIQFEDGKMIR